MRKRWADTDLEFFSGSNMLVCLGASMLRPSLKLVNFHLLTSSRLLFDWMSYLITSSRLLPQNTSRSPRDRTISDFRWFHICAEGFELPGFFLVIFNYLEYFGLAIQRLSSLFIYLFIYSISVFYEPFNCVTFAAGRQILAEVNISKRHLPLRLILANAICYSNDNNQFCPVSWGCEIDRLHLCRGVTSPRQRVSCIWHKTIWW